MKSEEKKAKMWEKKKNSGIKNKENLNYKKGDWTEKVPKIQKQAKKTSSMIKGARLLVTTE